MSNRNRQAAVAALFACALCMTGLGADAANYSIADRSTPLDQPSDFVMPVAAAPSSDYSGYLRLYIVEPAARWNDNSGNPYHYGFLDFALDSSVALNVGDRFVRSTTWDASTNGISGLTESNTMVIAVLSNDYPNIGYSNPPSANPFAAYYVDATAYALAGFCDSNNTSGNSTHTVFAEEATAVWCPYCPAVNYWLNYVKNTGNYNFIYAALVDDRNTNAAKRIDEFNIAYFPTTYLDGGNQILIGGYTAASYYINAIQATATRTVSGANVMLKVTWLGGGDLQIDYAVALGTPINTCAFPAAPTGETNPLINDPNLYTASVTDPEGDDMWYRYDWGDGQISDWQGPYASGDPCSQTHAWQAVGSYDVRVQSRDTWLAQSPWSAPLTVEAGCCVKRGDFNNDGSIAVSDLTALIAFLFRGGPTPSCLDHGDTNGDGVIAVSDLTLLIGYLFRGGASPAACS